MEKSKFVAILQAEIKTNEAGRFYRLTVACERLELPPF